MQATSKKYHTSRFTVITCPRFSTIAYESFHKCGYSTLFICTELEPTSKAMHRTSLLVKFTEFRYTKLSTPTLCFMAMGYYSRRLPSNQLIVFCYAESIV